MKKELTKNTIPMALFSGIMNPVAVAYLMVSHLKQIYRKGYLIEPRNVEADKCESVADHCFGLLALITFIMTSYKIELDWQRVMLMAIIHEFGEVYAGDITPKDGVSGEEKYALERISVRLILNEFPGGDELIEIWEEYEAQLTPESRFVRQLDKLEMGLQSCIYHRQYGMPNEDFVKDVESSLSDPILVNIFRSILHSA